MDGAIKNFLGMPVHPTDELLHWRDKNADALKLRAAFDALLAVCPEAAVHVKVLTDAAYELAANDAAEVNAGESM